MTLSNQNEKEDKSEKFDCQPQKIWNVPLEAIMYPL